MSIKFDVNRRSDFILNDTDAINKNVLQSIVDIALPFINLHAGASRAAGVALGLHRVVTVINKEAPATHRAAELAPIIGAIALSILFPVYYYALSQGLSLARHLYEFGDHVWHLEGKAAAKEFFLAASQLVHTLSFIFALPEFILLSLLMQAVTEATEALSEKGRPEKTFAKIALCLIRTAQAVPHARTLHRNYYGKTLTSELFQKIYSESTAAKKNGSEEIDLHAILKREWISSHVKGIDFKYKLLNRVIFKHMRFKNCDFSGTSFYKSKLHNVYFESTLFNKAIWLDSICKNIHFNKCSLEQFGIIHCNASDIFFLESELFYTCFNSSTLRRIGIWKSRLKETSFLFAKVIKGMISKSSLEDVIFAGARHSFSKDDCQISSSGKPIIAMSWNFRYSGMTTPIIYKAIGENGALPIRYEQFPDEIDPALLKKEVMRGLKEIERDRPDDMLSRPHELLKRSTHSSQIARLKERAKELSRYVNGFALPGGCDIEPEFYGQSKDEDTYCETDLRRSMIEFAILNQAYDQRIPVMGTCRGSQMANVFLGGTLKQHVEGHFGDQKLQWTDSPYTHIFQQFISEEMIGESMHHQASRWMGKDLEVILEYQGVPKLFISKDGNILGVQFHPEEHIDNIKTLGKILTDEDSAFKQVRMNYLKNRIENNQNIYRYFIAVCATA